MPRERKFSMALNNLGLGFVFTAKNLATPTFRQVNREFQQTAAATDAGAARIEQSMKVLQAGFLVTAAGAAALGGSLALANAAGKFEQGIAGVAAITRATTKDLAALRETAIEAGIKTQFSPTEAIEGLKNLGQLGLNAKDSMKVLQPALALAAGSLGQLGVAEAANLAGQSMRAFNLEAKDAGFAVDKMLRATNSFALSAGELPLALGIGARGATALSASLDDVIISLGLVKNVMPSAERASTSVAVAMERLARKQSQQKLQTLLGVNAVEKATGTFRPWLDIVEDMSKATAKMTPVQASNAMQMIFGARAAGGISAMLKQLRDGVKTSTGEIVKGSKAIAYYRKTMSGAGGAAKDFADKMLDTFEGQKTLLKGTLQTMAVVFGESFAKVLKPLVKTFTDALNFILKVWNKMPMGIKKGLSAFILAAGAITTMVGAILLAKGAIALLGVSLGGIIGMVGSVIASLWPLWLAIGAGILIIQALKVAYGKNIGGIVEWARTGFEKVKLFFEAMVQLFNRGAFSGAVLKELEKAGNQGIESFAIQVYVVFNRIKNFFTGLARGFAVAIEANKPVFEAFVRALRALGEAFSFVMTKADPEKNVKRFKAWGAVGADIGTIFARVAEVLAVAMTTSIRVVTGLVTGMGIAWKLLGPVLETTWTQLGLLWDSFSEIFVMLGLVTNTASDSGATWQALGTTIATVAGAIATAIMFVGNIVRAALYPVITMVKIVMSLFSAMWGIIEGGVMVVAGLLTGDWAAAWMGAKKIVFHVINAVLQVFGHMIEGIAGTVSSIAAVFGKKWDLGGIVRDYRKQLSGGLMGALGVEAVVRSAEPSKPAARPVARTFGRSLAGQEVKGYGALAMRRVEAAQEAGFSQEQVDQLVTAIKEQGSASFTIELDGEVLAQGTADANKRGAQRAFLAQPVMGAAWRR